MSNLEEHLRTWIECSNEKWDKRKQVVTQESETLEMEIRLGQACSIMGNEVETLKAYRMHEDAIEVGGDIYSVNVSEGESKRFLGGVGDEYKQKIMAEFEKKNVTLHDVETSVTIPMTSEGNREGEERLVCAKDKKWSMDCVSNSSSGTWNIPKHLTGDFRISATFNNPREGDELLLHLSDAGAPYNVLIDDVKMIIQRTNGKTRINGNVNDDRIRKNTLIAIEYKGDVSELEVIGDIFYVERKAKLMEHTDIATPIYACDLRLSSQLETIQKHVSEHEYISTKDHIKSRLKGNYEARIRTRERFRPGDDWEIHCTCVEACGLNGVVSKSLEVEVELVRDEPIHEQEDKSRIIKGAMFAVQCVMGAFARTERNILPTLGEVKPINIRTEDIKYVSEEKGGADMPMMNPVSVLMKMCPTKGAPLYIKPLRQTEVPLIRSNHDDTVMYKIPTGVQMMLVQSIDNIHLISKEGMCFEYSKRLRVDHPFFRNFAQSVMDVVFEWTDGRFQLVVVDVHALEPLLSPPRLAQKRSIREVKKSTKNGVQHQTPLSVILCAMGDDEWALDSIHHEAVNTIRDGINKCQENGVDLYLAQGYPEEWDKTLLHVKNDLMKEWRYTSYGISLLRNLPPREGALSGILDEVLDKCETNDIELFKKTHTIGSIIGSVIAAYAYRFEDWFGVAPLECNTSRTERIAKWLVGILSNLKKLKRETDLRVTPMVWGLVGVYLASGCLSTRQTSDVTMSQIKSRSVSFGLTVQQKFLKKKTVKKITTEFRKRVEFVLRTQIFRGQCILPQTYDGRLSIIEAYALECTASQIIDNLHDIVIEMKKTQLAVDNGENHYENYEQAHLLKSKYNSLEFEWNDWMERENNVSEACRGNGCEYATNKLALLKFEGRVEWVTSGLYLNRAMEKIRSLDKESSNGKKRSRDDGHFVEEEYVEQYMDNYQTLIVDFIEYIITTEKHHDILLLEQLFELVSVLLTRHIIVIQPKNDKENVMKKLRDEYKTHGHEIYNKCVRLCRTLPHKWEEKKEMPIDWVKLTPDSRFPGVLFVSDKHDEGIEHCDAMMVKTPKLKSVTKITHDYLNEENASFVVRSRSYDKSMNPTFIRHYNPHPFETSVNLTINLSTNEVGYASGKINSSIALTVKEVENLKRLQRPGSDTLVCKYRWDNLSGTWKPDIEDRYLSLQPSTALDFNAVEIALYDHLDVAKFVSLLQ